MKKVDIIVPCYNEEDMIDMFYRETVKTVNTIENYSFRFIFADDGSRDGTYQKLMGLAQEHEDVKFLSFSRNASSMTFFSEKNFSILRGIM